MVLAGLGLNSAEVLLLRNQCSTEHVSDEVATSTEPLSKPVACPAGVCLLVAASSFFTASESNVREFWGDGSGRFGFEFCLGSAVSQPCSTEHVSDDVATSTQPFSKPVACPAGVCLLVVASSFFRASESNVSHFYAGWFWQVWAWILLGSAVSQPCSTEPLADEVATSTEPLAKPVACLGGVSLLVVASFFFRASESNVREF